MARVGLTKELYSSVCSKVRKLYEAQIEEAENSKPNIGETLYKIFMEEAGVSRSMFEGIPEKFLCTYNEMHVRWRDSKNAEQRVVYGFSDFRPMEEGWGSSYASKLELKDALLIQLLEEWKDRIKKARAECQTAINTVQSVMDQCTTVNQLLKLAPDMRTLFAQDVLARVEEKTERATTAKTVDSNALENLSNVLAVGVLSGDL